ncbi:30S ribosome-binding factor RbfA [Endomicrobium proavitum]|uniref:Ribosome-binding factor A n=1 Tax=Endomicrobium proavitum TaxID=1408281 RepID=A0A0G3WJX0_9BACT|nr:30S ribosome-binding factor RbfA [Endomicrobium proavitum]AKL98172.1 Ribosome-binding factor A [Endomicrobium proavitum]
MPNSYKRSTRVAELIQHVISELVREIKEEGIGFVTVMGIKLTDDLLDARVFYSVLGTDEEKTKADKVLKNKTKEIRHELAGRLNLRRTPTIIFEYDDSTETATKVFDLLKKIEDEKK